MTRKYVKDNSAWKIGFGQVLKSVFESFEIEYEEFANKHDISPSAMRYWFNGRSLPQKFNFQKVKYFIKNEVTTNHEQTNNFKDALLNFFKGINDEDSYYSLERQNPNVLRLAVAALDELFTLAKYGNRLDCSKTIFESTGHIQVVVFDFDGTLTNDKKGQTTWEMVWKALGYELEECKLLHHKFDEGLINHGEWCSLTEEKFKARNMHRDILAGIAKKIHLIKGVKTTLAELQKHDIAIYIVSGSIMTVIQKVLGSANQYVQEIQANVFKFSQAGFLTEIVGTQFDFEGKARYITMLSNKYKISPQDILFVGNSVNDRFAYRSGCKTLCVNPRLIDATNKEMFNHCIPCMENLAEVLQYIE